MLAMTRQIEKAMEAAIKTLDWMSDKTKARALEKLASMANKIGYPDKWRDYSKLEIVRGDALGNMERASGFEIRRQLAKIGEPVNCCRLSSLLAKGPRASRSIPLAELDQGARSGTNLIRSSEPASWMA